MCPTTYKLFSQANPARIPKKAERLHAEKIRIFSFEYRFIALISADCILIEYFFRAKINLFIKDSVIKTGHCHNMRQIASSINENNFSVTPFKEIGKVIGLNPKIRIPDCTRECGFVASDRVLRKENLPSDFISSFCDGFYAISFCVCASQSYVFFFFYRKA